MTIIPMGARVLVKKDVAEEKTASGLILASSAKEAPMMATVLAVGEEVKHLAVGDRVMFGKYTGNDVNIDGDDCIIFDEEEILAIVK